MRTFASIISAVAVVSMFWFHVVPNGVELCASATPFATIDSTNESQVDGAVAAKSSFCSTVASVSL